MAITFMIFINHGQVWKLEVIFLEEKLMSGNKLNFSNVQIGLDMEGLVY